MKQTPEVSPSKPTKSFTFEGQVPPFLPQNKRKITKTFPRIFNSDRKREPTILSSIHSKNPFFGTRTVHLPKENKLSFDDFESNPLQRHSRSININLKRLSSLQNLCLHFNSYGVKPTAMDCYEIIQTLKRSVSLQSFKLDIVDCREMTNKDLHYLGKALKRLPSLKHFDFSFEFSQHITEEGLNHLSKSLKRVPSLERLTLDLIDCSEFTDIGVSTLSSSLKNLLLLKSLMIRLHSGYNIGERGFLDFCDSLERLACLQSLSLTLRGIQLKEEGSKRFGEVLKKLISLRSLTIDFGFDELFKSLKSLLFLENLTIDCSCYNEYDDGGFLDFCDSLERLSCLRSLRLKLRGIPMTDLGFKRFCEAFRNLISLRSLDITLPEIFSSSFCEFFNGLKELVCLQEMRIYLSRFDGMHSQELFCLSQALQRLGFLRNFKIIFESHRNCFDEQGLSHLSKGLKGLKLLEQCQLSFYCSPEMGDKGLCQLSKGLEKLVLLRELSVRLTGSKKITNEGALNFCKVLKNFPKLKKFEFYLDQCPNFTDNGLYMMFEMFKEMPSLEVFCYERGYDHCEFDMKSSDISDLLKFLTKYLPNYKEITERKLKRNLLNRFFILSVCGVLIGALAYWAVVNIGEK